MPGRQAHGRPVSAGALSRRSGKPKHKGRVAALDAFAIAESETPAKKKGIRTRDLDPEPEQKRRRPQDPEEDEDLDGGAGPENSRSKRRKTDRDGEDSSLDGGSDSEGNEWRVGLGDDDDDSEIDSDDAFGESDEERFEGFAFRGSSSAKKTGNAPSDKDQGEDDDESLGEDAIDLAQALDEVSDEDELSVGSGSKSEDEESAPDMPDTDDDDEDEDDDDLGKYDALQSLVAGLDGGGAQDDVLPKASAKVDLQDLGLSGVKDRNIQKSLKLLRKEEKATKPGSTKKLDVPLARRQQDRLHRIAASEQANKTLDRWTDTVKQNRRAEHLIFPLPDLLPGAGLDSGDLRPLNRKNAGTELESTILSIMEESGLGPSAKPPPEEQQGNDEEKAGLSKTELQSLWTERRRARALESREQARAKRIKKIKSKSFRRIQRRKAMKEVAAMEGSDAEGGDQVDSDEEREAQHVRRATERMGARHRDSKWAKLAKNTGRAAWDDDFRAGLKDMARRDEDLRRRVEGRGDGSDEDGDASDASGSDDGDTRQRLLRELDEVEAIDPDEPVSNIMKMPFMQMADAERKRLNDESIARIRRELARDDGESDEEEEAAEVGRRTYGMARANNDAGKPQKATDMSKGRSAQPSLDDELFTGNGSEAFDLGDPNWGSQSKPTLADKTQSAWAEPKNRKARRKAKKGQETAGLSAVAVSELLAPPSLKPSVSLAATDTVASEDALPSDDEAVVLLPAKARGIGSLAHAFAADDRVETDFAAEKVQVVEDEGDKTIDNTLPGWGSWVGEGVSKRAVKRDQKKFQTVVKGVKQADRKDAKLDRVIINERRVKKNDRYLASQLPHEFENLHQYQRSLRLPLGPEWSTKESFQDATKPRVILKQGIIAPMARPMARRS